MQYRKLQNTHRTSHIAHIIIGLCVLVFINVSYAECFVKLKDFQYKEGMVSLRAKQTSLFDILEEISESSGVQLYLFDQNLPRYITVNFVDRPLQDVLRSILKGCSYAVVYSEGKAVNGGVYMMKGSQRTGKYGKPTVSGASNMRAEMGQNASEQDQETLSSMEQGLNRIEDSYRKNEGEITHAAGAHAQQSDPVARQAKKGKIWGGRQKSREQGEADNTEGALAPTQQQEQGSPEKLRTAGTSRRRPYLEYLRNNAKKLEQQISSGNYHGGDEQRLDYYQKQLEEVGAFSDGQ